MKNAYIFSLILLISSGLHAMESEQLPDLKAAENALANIYKNVVVEYYGKALNNKQISMGNLIDYGEYLGLNKTNINETLIKTRLADGNTITHSLVLWGLTYDLALCARQEIISLEKNEKDLNAYDEAFTKFFNYVKQPTIATEAQSDFQKTRCSYLILANYIKIKQGKKDECIDCCKKHNFFANDSDTKI